MREIKFRAWSKSKPYTENESASVGVEKMMDWQDIISDFQVALEDPDVELMQFTGIKDKNGKEVYESDLVKLMEWKDNPDIYKIHPITYRVDWDEGNAKFHMYSPSELWGNLPNGKPRETDIGIEIFRDFNSNEQIIEIIGNIYENPELIS